MMRKTKLVKIILICFGLFTILNLFFKPIKAESNEFFIKFDRSVVHGKIYSRY